MRILVSLVLIYFCFNTINAQYTEAPITNRQFNEFEKSKFTTEQGSLTNRILPVSLITVGVLLSTSSFEKSLQKNIRNLVGNDFYSGIDDYTRYAPVVQMYAADIMGVQSRNHWFDQTKNLVLSSIISNGVSTLLKKEVHKYRPGGSDHANSFPSGHTTTAFTTATVLFEEFKNTNPVLAYSGYIFAITTGSLRLANNMHYLSDVLVGAGIGILATKLVYHFEHLIAWNPFKKMKGIAFTPQYSNNSGLGFYFSKTL
ncbi:phosphatase PAP2 family protein [Aquimarina mytili]|uniref:Phosphatase PAP2 family protein n=1 Tax=Aquimarina mytili TaxID=874423 RepID=A0A937D6B1_9FLAO|nr:phosphatase PAP2 family protein [Aquimarina mytili]MBL0684204.1 phosphatase PAP2 family protein [Aquimarina mytili]